MWRRFHVAAAGATGLDAGAIESKQIRGHCRCTELPRSGLFIILPRPPIWRQLAKLSPISILLKPISCAVSSRTDQPQCSNLFNLFAGSRRFFGDPLPHLSRCRPPHPQPRQLRNPVAARGSPRSVSSSTDTSGPASGSARFSVTAPMIQTPTLICARMSASNRFAI